jgi:hypothetical protein
VVQFETALKGHGFRGCENSLSHLILGGAALQRCDKGFALNPALAAEGPKFPNCTTSRLKSRLVETRSAILNFDDEKTFAPRRSPFRKAKPENPAFLSATGQAV